MIASDAQIKDTSYKQVDVLSIACSVLALVYVTLRGFKLENLEFLCLLGLLVVVLGIGLYSYQYRHEDIIKREYSPEQFMQADDKYLSTNEPDHNISIESRANEFRRVIKRLFLSAWGLIIVLWKVRVERPIRRQIRWTKERSKVMKMPESFLDFSYARRFTETPGKVRYILEPKLKKIAQGFQGGGSGESSENVFVGDGKQEEWDNKDEEDKIDGVHAEDYYDDRQKFPHLWLSDEEYEVKKNEYLERKRKEEEENKANVRRSNEENESHEDDVSGPAKRFGEQNKKNREERERARAEGRLDEDEEEEEEEEVADEDRIMSRKRMTGNAQLRDESIDNTLKEDDERKMREAGAEDDKDQELKDDNGIPLRFDMKRYKKMLLEYLHLDYALCRLKHYDSDLYKLLMRLDWLDKYKKMK